MIVLRVPDPELELDRLIGAVDRTVGNHERLGLVVLGVVMPTRPGAAESVVGDSVGMQA